MCFEFMCASLDVYLYAFACMPVCTPQTHFPHPISPREMEFAQLSSTLKADNSQTPAQVWKVPKLNSHGHGRKMKDMLYSLKSV